jgi:TonB family protein
MERRVPERVSLGLALCLAILGCAHPAPLPECPAPLESGSLGGPFGSYFRDVKARVFKNWDPNTPLREHDPKGNQYGMRDRYTILDVTLDGAGEISALRVSRTSGLAFLDDAAIEAFRRAAPFGPPPPGLLGKDGTVVFPFGFYLEVGAAPHRCRPVGRKPEGVSS